MFVRKKIYIFDINKVTTETFLGSNINSGGIF